MSTKKTIAAISVTAALLGSAACVSALAQSGPAHVQPMIGKAKKPDTNPPAEQDNTKTIQDIDTRLQNLEKTMPKVKPARANAALNSQLTQWKANFDSLKSDFEAVKSGGSTPGSKEGDDKKGGNEPTPTNSKTTTSVPTIPNSSSNYMDDLLRWDMPIHVYPTGATGGVDLNTPLCLPADIKVKGLKSTFTSATPTDSSTAKNYLPVRLDSPGPISAKLQSPTGNDAPSSPRMCDQGKTTVLTGDDLLKAEKDTDNQFVIYSDTQFFVGADDLEDAAFHKGWDFGTLVVPFKFQMSDKSIVTGSASLGGYVGYDFGINVQGFRLRPVAFVGVSEISLPDAGGNPKKPTSDTVAGLSYGVGLMGTIKDSFNISLVFGADHVSSKSYQYQDKPWVSFALGYSFTK